MTSYILNLLRFYLISASLALVVIIFFEYYNKNEKEKTPKIPLKWCFIPIGNLVVFVLAFPIFLEVFIKKLWDFIIDVIFAAEVKPNIKNEPLPKTPE